MRVFIGDELGYSKLFVVETGEVVGQHCDATHSPCMFGSFAREPSTEPGSIIVTHASHSIQTLNSQTLDLLTHRSIVSPDLKDKFGPCYGIGFESDINSFLAVMSNGSVLSGLTDGKFETKGTTPEHIVGTDPSDGQYCVKVAADFGLVAYGGKHKNAKIFDVAKGEEVFRAKNIKRNDLGVKHQVFVSALAFGDNPWQLYAGSGFGEIFGYDTRAQRKPVMQLEPSEYRVRSLAFNKQLVWGDVFGQLGAVDVSQGKESGRFSGHSGAILGISFGEGGRYVASVGRDRWLYVHDVDTRSIYGRVHTKQMCRTVILVDSAEEIAAAGSESEASSSDDEAFDEVIEDSEGSEAEDDDSGSEGDMFAVESDDSDADT